MGVVKAICTSEKKGTKKLPKEEGVFLVDYGIKGDAHGGFGHRQVSLLADEEIQKFKNKGAEIEWGSFGENLVIEGYDLKTMPVGTTFQCGEVVLEVTQIGKQCHQGCDIFQTMGDCIMPREGIFCKVNKGGIIRTGSKFLKV